MKYKKLCSNARTKRNKAFFILRVIKHWKKVARRCCGVPNLVDCHHLEEHGPKRPASADPALRGGDRLGAFQRSPPTSTIPRLCVNPELCKHTSLVYQALINDTYTNNCSVCFQVIQTLFFSQVAELSSKMPKDKTPSECGN